MSFATCLFPKSCQKAARWLLAAVLVVLAPAAFAASDPNTARGFSPGQVYDVGEIDSVNPFNGNLILQIPIGPAVQVRPGFSYQLMLSYNSSVWDFEFRDHENYPNDPEPNYKRFAVPETHSNAGLGWILSLGQLFKPVTGSPTTKGHDWLYVEPNGSEHEFMRERWGTPSQNGELYTFDGSYLRLVHGPADAWHDIEFPDGTIRRFNFEGLLTEIRDRFGNRVSINVTPDLWTITDTGASGRQQKIHFKKLDSLANTHFYRVVSLVELTGPEGRTLSYTFDYLDGDPQAAGYQPNVIDRGGYGDKVMSEDEARVAVLDHVTLPDGSQFRAQTHVENFPDTAFGNPHNGSIHHLELPSGATLDWRYGNYELSVNECDPEHFWTSIQSGVELRTVTVTADSDPSVWTYTRTLTRKPMPEGQTVSTACPPHSGRFLNLPFYPPDEFQSTVRDPHGIETTHYFAIYPEGALGGNNQFNNASDYGQPFSRRPLNPDDHSLPIQSEVLDCRTIAACPAVGTTARDGHVLRRTYVDYANDGWNGDVRWNSRKILERVEYLRESIDAETKNCDGKVCYVESRFDDFDGYGNFRDTIVETNFPGQPSRVSRASYNPGSDRFGKTSGGAMFFGIDDPWILGRFTDRSLSAVSGGTPETKSDYCFDPVNGFLNRQRVRRTAAGTKRDIVTTYADPNHDGVVDEESMWGGDPLPGESSDPLPEATWSCGEQSYGPLRSRVQHTYSNGILATSKIAGSPFFSLDQTIGMSGAVSSARDPQGLATTLKYEDAFGRLTEVHPPGNAPWTHFAYAQRSGSTPASLTTRTFPSTEGSGGTPLTYSRAYYDGLGRLIQTKLLMPDGTWSAVGTIYDATGRARSTSMPQPAALPDFTPSFDPAQKTQFEYDALGRVVKTTASDDTITERDFEIKVPEASEIGDPTRVVTTTVKLGTGANGTLESVPTVEKYDGFGRLRSVTESIGANGVKTKYDYDLSDRLRTVTSGTQTPRSFVYDGAGLLTSEVHPENGTSTYTWDAGGRVTTKRVGTEEIRSVYDFAGRVKSVKDQTRNLELLVFDYDTATGPNGESMAANGRLLRQVRYNNFAGTGTFAVADYFTYDNTARLSQKETVVTDPAGASSRFTLPFEYHPESSLPAKQKYPTCTGCTGAVLPQRAPDLAWSAGMLRSVSGFVDGITYRPHGGIAEVRHSNGVTDIYDADPDGMARPQAIRVTSANQCDLIETPPTSETTSVGGSAVLHVAAKDPAASITWYRGFRGETDVQVGTGTTLTLTNVTSSQFYWVRVQAIQGGCVSDSSTVTVAPCAPPEILTPAASSILFVVAPNATVDAEVTAVATNISYAWKLLPADTEIAACRNSRTCSWAPTTLNQQQELQVTVSGSCGPPVTRVIKRFMLIDGSCIATIAASFPPEIPLLDDGSIELSVLMEARHDPYVFHWFLDDSLVSTEDERSADPSTFGRSSLNISVGSGTLSVQITRYCAPGGVGIQSPTVIQKTFVWDGDDCPIPKVKLNQTSITLGTPDVSRTFIAQSDWGSLRYEWYEGDSGNTRQERDPDPGAPDKFTAPNATGTYWVRAISPCGTQWDSPTLVVSSATCEIPVRFTQQPQSAILHAGTQTTLRYDATAKPLPNSTKWYEGTGATTLVGSAPSLTVAPLRTTTYWAEVSNGCSTSKSAYATLNVRTCSAINYTLAGREYEISPGQLQPLSITATATNGRPLFIKWYEGHSGDTSKPAQVPQTFQVSVQPAKTTTYWARIDFNDPALCAVDTDEITVYLCSEPRVTQAVANTLSPVPYTPHWIGVLAEGERLRYQWYIGPKGVRTLPLLPGRMQKVAPAETTTYWVEITNDCRVLADKTLPDNEDVELVVSVCPSDLVVTAAHAELMPGMTTTLNVTASGGSLKYKWYRGESGDTWNPFTPGVDPTDSATVTTPPLTADTNYWVRVYSGECFRNSNTITVKRCTKPTVQWMTGLAQVHASEPQILGLTVDPANVQITYYSGTPGNTGTSQVVAGPTVNRGVSISPATTTTYWARAKIEGSVCYSDTAGFTVNVCIPTITTHPQPAFFNSTTAPSVTLTVAASAATTYQWYIGDSGVTSSPIAGATGTSLTVSPSADTKYWARATGSCTQSADSTAALVTVCKAPVITTTPASRIATANAQVPLDLVATGSNLTYQWYRGASGVTTTPIAGATSASYTATQNVTSDYWVRVSGSCGSVNSATIKISVAPVITTPPATQYINSGSNASFTVVATGTELLYRWYSGSTVLTTQTAATMTTPALTTTTTYWVRVWSGAAYADSAEVSAFVCQPKSINVDQPVSVTGGRATLTVASPDANETYEWFVWTTPTTSQQVSTGTIATFYPNQTTDYTLRTRRSTCYADRRITVTVCTPVINTHPAPTTMINPGGTTRLTVAATGTPAMTYQWFIGASGTTTNPISGAVNSFYDAAPANDTNYWVRVTSGAGASCTAYSNTATVNVCKPPAITAQPANLNAPANSTATIGVTATGTNLSYQWYRGTAGVTTAPVGLNQATLSVQALQTEDYWVRITGQCGTVNSTAAKISVAPSITSPPAHRFITSGTTTTFTVTASGSQLSYQWFQGSTVVGTGTSYTTPALTTSTAYWVRAWSGNAYTDSSLAWAFVCTGRSISVSQSSQSSNSRVDLFVVSPAGDETYDWYADTAGDPSKRVGGGTAVMVYPLVTTTYYLRTSKSGCYADTGVTVLVLYPTFSTHPQNASINAGGSATLTASATGTPPLTYQWYANGSAISGATSTSVTVSPASTTSYYLQARSGGYSTNGNTATVSVCVPPAITSQPPSSIIYYTDTVTLSVGATGSGLTYQWYQGASGSTTTPVGTGSTLVIQPVTTKSYWVRVTGQCGSVNSAAALQSVRPTITSQPADAQVCAGAQATVSVNTSTVADSYTWYRVDGQTNTYIGSGPSIPVSVPSAITVWCDIASGNAHTYSRMVSLTTRPGPAVSLSKWYVWEGAYRLQANVAEEDLPYASYVWYRGVMGNIAQSQYYSEGYAVMAYASATTELYWVRVTNTQTGCWTDRGVYVP